MKKHILKKYLICKKTIAKNWKGYIILVYRGKRRSMWMCKQVYWIKLVRVRPSKVSLHHDNILKDSNPNGRNPFLLYTACLYLNEDACTMQIACSQVFFTVNNNCAFVEFGSRKMSWGFIFTSSQRYQYQYSAGLFATQMHISSSCISAMRCPSMRIKWL